MTRIWLCVLLPILALSFAPENAVAQCETPEGCKNIEDFQACVEPDQAESDIFEDCHVEQGFCQLSECCDESCGGGGGQSFTLDRFPADLRVTPAGTFAMHQQVIRQAAGEPVRSCRGYIIVPADPQRDRPTVITLD